MEELFGKAGVIRESVQDQRRVAYLAAWKLLYVIEDLYPDFAAELRDVYQSAPEWDAKNAYRDYARTRAKLVRWLRARGLSGREMSKAAWLWARGNTPVHSYLPEFPEYEVESNRRRWRVFPNVFKETRREFLARAAAAWDEVTALAKKRGFRLGPSKREIDHFRWLAHYKVGGLSWPAIAELEGTRGRKGLAPKSLEKEARALALLIGLPWSKQPGRRKGTKNTPRVHRRD